MAQAGQRGCSDRPPPASGTFPLVVGESLGKEIAPFVKLKGSSWCMYHHCCCGLKSDLLCQIFCRRTDGAVKGKFANFKEIKSCTPSVPSTFIFFLHLIHYSIKNTVFHKNYSQNLHTQNTLDEINSCFGVAATLCTDHKESNQITYRGYK